MSKLLGVVLGIVDVLLLWSLINTSFIPNFLLIIVLVVINVFLIIGLTRKKAYISVIIYILLAVVCLLYLYKTNKFISTVTSNKSLRENYYLVSNEKTLDNLVIGVYKEDNLLYEEAIKKLDKSYTLEPCNSIEDMISKLASNQVDAVFISNYHKNSAVLEDTVILNTIEVQIEEKISKTHLEDSENIYITTTDGFDNNLRNIYDTNLIATINFKTKKSLLTKVPDDYYVTLENENKELLKRIGINGIKSSIDAIENLMNIKINHYIKLDYSSLIKVVDEIGGIDIYLDKPFSGSVTLDSGLNNINTHKALILARDGYKDVILKAIFNKLKKNFNLLNKQEVLNIISNSIQTNIVENDINDLIKHQTNNFKSWTISEYNLTGNTIDFNTVTSGKDKETGINPSQQSIENGKNKINNILKGITK